MLSVCTAQFADVKLTWLLPGPVTVALRWGRKTRNPGGPGFQAIRLDELAGDVMAGLGGAAGSAPEVRQNAYMYCKYCITA